MTEILITVPLPENSISRLEGISTRAKITLSPALKVSEIPSETWEKTEVLYTSVVLPEPEQVPNLRWLQFHYAGIDRFIEEPLLKKDGLQITTLSGAAAPQMGEYILTMLLALAHKIPAVITHQKKSDWPRDRFERFSPFELRGKTIGIIGYGSAARQAARLLQPFGVTILATKHNAMNPEDTGYIPEECGDPRGDFVHRIYPPEALRSMLKQCHFVVVTAPITPHTRNLLNAETLEALRPGAYLVDVSRGGITNHTDLINAIKNGKITGAALDVFPEEPLPATSPLWQMSNVIITPHISGSSPHYNERALVLFSENLHRYLGGLPLYNIFDPSRGY